VTHPESVHRHPVEHLMRAVLEARSVEQDLFVEVLDQHQAFTEEERCCGAVACQDHRVVMVSAPLAFCLRLEPGLFGLSLLPVGSYLVTQDPEPVHVGRSLA
jgi:hypothetical protein